MIIETDMTGDETAKTTQTMKGIHRLQDQYPIQRRKHYPGISGSSVIRNQSPSDLSLLMISNNHNERITKQ